MSRARPLSQCVPRLAKRNSAARCVQSAVPPPPGPASPSDGVRLDPKRSRVSQPGWIMTVSQLRPAVELPGEPLRFRDAIDEFVTRFASGRAEDDLAAAAQELGMLARDQKIAAETAVVAFRRVWSREVSYLGHTDIWLSGELRRYRVIDALLQGYYGRQWLS